MRRYLYLSTAVAGVMMMSGNANAQCVTSQDCTTLGYTQTSCPDGKGLKCPFGNKWYCPPSTQDTCRAEGFTLACNGTGQIGGSDACGGLYKKCACNSTYKYTCSGTGYSGGSGTACGGKYTSCKCASGYEWKNGACTSTRPVCAVGSLYYSDNTCSTSKVSGKTLLGVVIYSNGASGGGWIMTVKPIQTGIAWGGYDTDISGLNNIKSESGLTDIQASCTNTDVITKYGNSSTYPAAWAAKNYKPSGTPSGKTWCLPSGGLLNSALNNSTNFAKINAGITTAGGTKLGYGGQPSYSYETVWSSSERSSLTAWYFYANTDGSFYISNGYKDYRSDYDSVRPVLAF